MRKETDSRHRPLIAELGVIEGAVPESEVLVGIAALGLTLTGFSGLVAVLNTRGTEQWTKGEQIQFFELITLSLAVTFLAFVPIVTLTFLSTQPALQVSNGVVAAGHAICLIRGVGRVVRNAEARDTYGRVAFIAIPLVGLLIIVAGIGSSFNIISTQSLTILLNLLWILFVAVVNFIQLLASNWGSDDA